MPMSMTKGVKIVPAKESDIPLLMELICELAEYEKLLHEVVATEEDLQQMLFSEGTTAQALLARVRGQAVGYALIFHNYSTFTGKKGLYLEDIFVKPEWRGRGIGRKLFMHCVKQACERDCSRMDWLVLDWNETSKDFYESLGAEPMNEWIPYRFNRDQLEQLAAPYEDEEE